MIRLRCPTCGAKLSVPDHHADQRIACPRCHEPLMAHSTAPAPRAARSQGEAAHSPTARRVGGWLVEAGLTAASVVGVIAVVMLPPGFPTHAAVVAAACTTAALLGCIYGHATSCPHCGKWGSRSLLKSEDGGREVVQRGGVTVGRTTTRMEYFCTDCHQRWVVTDAEEYRVPEQRRTWGAGH